MKYKDEVLGKRVEVEFKVGTITQFFPGTIQKLKMELTDGIISCHHFIMLPRISTFAHSLAINLQSAPDPSTPSINLQGI